MEPKPNTEHPHHAAQRTRKSTTNRGSVGRIPLKPQKLASKFRRSAAARLRVVCE